MKQSIDITIASKFIASGVEAAKRGMATLASKTKAAASAIGGNLMNIKAGFDMAASAIKTFVSALSKGMEFERMTTQFKSLTGSIDLARAHMKDLQDLGRTPPFSLEQFAAASVAMMKMTGGMAGLKHEMEIVGDLAAATGNDIATVGRAFGLAYQVIRDGQDFGRAGQQLYSLGIMTKAQVAEFAELSKSATDNMAVWEKLQEVFARYRGAMAETEATTKGLIEAIQGEATVAMTDFSTAISESAKPALEGLLGYLRRINEDGTIEDWADSCLDAFDRIKDGAKPLLNTLGTVFDYSWKFIKGTFESYAQAAGNAIGIAANGGSFKDVARGAWEGLNQGWTDVLDLDGAEAAHRESKREARRKKKADNRAEQSRLAEKESEARIEDDFHHAKTKRLKSKERIEVDDEDIRKATEDIEKLTAQLEAIKGKDGKVTVTVTESHNEKHTNERVEKRVEDHETITNETIKIDDGDVDKAAAKVGSLTDQLEAIKGKDGKVTVTEEHKTETKPRVSVGGERKIEAEPKTDIKSEPKQKPAINIPAKTEITLDTESAEKYLRSALARARRNLATATADRAEAVEQSKKEQEDAAKKRAEEEKKIAKIIAAEDERIAKEQESIQNKIARDLLQEQIEGVRMAHESRMRQLDEEKRKAEEAARVWEQAANRAQYSARQGGGFARWNANERDTERANERAKRKQNNAIENAKKEADRLRKDMARGKGFVNPQKVKHLADLDKFIAYQDPANNPGKAEAERIEKEKAEDVAKLKTTVETIQTQLSSLGL